MAGAALPRLNYRCFAGLELRDIMKQCGALRGNYPAALPPLRSLARGEKMNRQRTEPLTPQKFHLPLPPSVLLPPGFGALGGGNHRGTVLVR